MTAGQNVKQAGETRPAESWALELSSRGFKIAPLRKGSKEPYGGESWKDAATTDPDTIRGWFRHRPSMNYAVNPGEDYAIIDLDVKETANGIEAFGDLQDEQSDRIMGETFTVKTPSGGRHLYVGVDSPVGNANTFPAGIDVRGVAGYVVGPGCTLEGGGTYEVLDDKPVRPAPQWVMARMQRGETRDKNTTNESAYDLDSEDAVRHGVDFLRSRDPAIEGVGGDEHTYITACQLIDLGLSRAKALELLTTPYNRMDGEDIEESWNDRCAPPWDADDLARKVANAWAYREKEVGAKEGRFEPEDMEGAVDLSNVIRLHDQAEPIDPNRREDSGWAGRIHRGRGVLDGIPPAETLVSGWLPARGVAALLARRGTGKTLVMLDMALTMASDGDWCGQPTARGLYTVYLCGEDAENTAGHVDAWCRTRGLDAPPERFLFVDGAPDLMGDQDWRDLAAAVRAEIGPDAKAVVFLDTWQRATSRGGQNRDEDMQQAVHRAEALGRSLGGPAVVAFHPPKNTTGTILGSSVIENATTAIWELTENHGMRRLEVTRIKGRGHGEYQLFRLDEVDLGRTEQHGGTVTGAVAVRQSGTGESEAARRDHEENVRVAYAELITSAMLESDDAANMTPKRVADLIAGLPMMLDGVETRAKNPKDLRDELPGMFALPCKLPDGNVLRLVDTGKKRGRGTVRVFRIEPHRDPDDQTSWTRAEPT